MSIPGIGGERGYFVSRVAFVDCRVAVAVVSAAVAVVEEP